MVFVNVVVELINIILIVIDLSYEIYYLMVVNGCFIGNDEDSDELEFELVISLSFGEFSFDKDIGLFVYEFVGELIYVVNFSYWVKDRFVFLEVKIVMINVVGKVDNLSFDLGFGGSVYYLIFLLLVMVVFRCKFKL